MSKYNMIIAAAVKKEWKIFSWTRHDHCIKMAYKCFGKQVTQEEQWFIDENGKYYTRWEAMEIVNNSWQLKHKMVKTPTLYSEDLW